MRKFGFLLFLFALAFAVPLSGCADDSDDDITARLLSSKFPPDLDVPIIAGSQKLDGTVGFAVQDNPMFVIPVDVNTDPIERSFDFPALDFSFLRPSGGSTFANDLYIHSKNLAALTYTGSDGSGNHISRVSLFDPENAFQIFNVDLRRTVSVPSNYQTVDYNSSSDSVSYRYVSSFSASFVSGVVIEGNFMYVSMSNLDPTSFNTYYPGTVFVYDLTPMPNNPPTFVATIFTGQDGSNSDFRYFNPTQVTLFGTNVLVASGGGIFFNSSFQSVAKTNSALEVIDTSSNTIISSQSYGLGEVGLGGEEVKLYNNSSTETIAVMASQIEGKLYRVNLTTQTILNSESNPIVINSQTGEVLSVAVSTNTQYFFVGSQQEDRVYVVDISSTNSSPSSPTIVNTFDVHDSASSGLTFPSNLEAIPARNGQQRVLYTTGDPPDVRRLEQ